MASGRRPDRSSTPEKERASKSLAISCFLCSQRIVDKSKSIECTICRNTFHYQCASQGALTEKLLGSLKINKAAYICRNDQILAIMKN